MSERALSLEWLVRDWTFVPSVPPARVRLARLKSCALGLRRAPAARVLRLVRPAPRWNVYFAFLPDGQLTPAHRFTLARLRAPGHALLTICASPRPDMVPDEMLAQGDAAIWKAMSGFDFSAYALALDTIATRSPGADVFIMNDSVLGPFGNLDPLLHGSPWDLTGFTAWLAFENHVQSYALFLRALTPARLRGLSSVLSRRWAFNHFQHVVNVQETRLARVAARTMSVGAFWYEPSFDAGDPSLVRAVALLDAGFPFLKRSLVGGKLADRHDQDALRRLLEERDHPR